MTGIYNFLIYILLFAGDSFPGRLFLITLFNVKIWSL